MSRESKQVDYSFKILTLGESCVGKTSILLRYTENNFIQTHLLTIGIDFKTKHITMNNKNVKLKLWDTAGQEKFRTLTQQYYKNADGILLIYDIKDRSSFEKIHSWMDQISYNSPGDGLPLVLIGNKCDCKKEERAVKTEELQRVAEEYNVKCFETSALSNKNIDECFTTLCQLIVEKKKISALIPNESKNESQFKLDLTSSSEKPEGKGKCCK